MDKIILTGMPFRAFHGVLPEEKALGQVFQIDLELLGDFRKAGREDNLAFAINYAEVYCVTKEIVEGTGFDLIEALAERIAGELLSKFNLQGVKVRVNKPQAPIPGIFANVAVEISRERENES